MQLLGFIVRRIVYALGLLLAVIVLNFVLLKLAPGDIVQTLVGDMGGASPELIAQLRTSFGLDQPFGTQLLNYLSKAVRGDLGQSAYFNQPVTHLIAQRVPATVILVITALTIAVVVGTLLGAVAARRPRSWFSAFVSIFALFGFAAPVFWTGLMLMLLFVSVIPLLPASGMIDISKNASGFAYLFDVLQHLVLPAVTLALVYLAFYARLARASMMEVLDADYIRTARAKGVSEGNVLLRHALRNAILPVVTVAGLQLSSMLAGAVLVESVFSWPGMGQLAYEAILRRDTQVILGILVFSALLVTIGNLITDMIYRMVDPRIRAGR